jgi:hypothetical protein
MIVGRLVVILTPARLSRPFVYWMMRTYWAKRDEA